MNNVYIKIPAKGTGITIRSDIDEDIYNNESGEAITVRSVTGKPYVMINGNKVTDFEVIYDGDDQ
jgi:hypothetical protein